MGFMAGHESNDTSAGSPAFTAASLAGKRTNCWYHSSSASSPNASLALSGPVSGISSSRSTTGRAKYVAANESLDSTVSKTKSRSSWRSQRR